MLGLNILAYEILNLFRSLVSVQNSMQYIVKEKLHTK